MTTDGLPYPLTLIRTRYGGSYEGGLWAAFNVEANRIPVDVEGGDPECAAWWAMAQANGGVYGRDLFGAACVTVGDTPDEAIAKLAALCVREGAYIA